MCRLVISIRMYILVVISVFIIQKHGILLEFNTCKDLYIILSR